jgi:hypothetical protein
VGRAVWRFLLASGAREEERVDEGLAGRGHSLPGPGRVETLITRGRGGDVALI